MGVVGIGVGVVGINVDVADVVLKAISSDLPNRPVEDSKRQRKY